MNNQIYVSKEYMADPLTIMFDKEMVEFNRIHTEGEYESTIMSINSIGQLSPIEINSYTGLCENGRHRVRACISLGIQVKCIKINGKLKREKRLEIYNIDIMSGRELNTAQKAIQAHKFAIASGENLITASKRFNTNERAVSAANSIAGLGRYDIIDFIFENGYWECKNKTKSKNLRAILSELKSENEAIAETKKDVRINYEEMIQTEKGKSNFWRLKTLANISDHEMSLIIVNYLNLKYVLKVDESTGEVSED